MTLRIEVFTEKIQNDSWSFDELFAINTDIKKIDRFFRVIIFNR